MIHSATQSKSRLKNYGKAPPVPVKHFVSCSYQDLVFLAQNLRGIKTETFTAELTGSVGDCCMMSICEWGPTRLEFAEYIDYFHDQEHMGHVGEFSCSVNETCLSCDHHIFMVAPSDTEAHNPLLVHLKSSDMGWKEKHAYVPPATKVQRKERRTDILKQNKRKGQGCGDGPLLDSSWDNWDGKPWALSKSLFLQMNFLYQLRILSIVRLNERLWRPEFHPCIFFVLVNCLSFDSNF